jgi:hypothetical protein
VNTTVVGTGHPYYGDPEGYIGTFTYRSLVLHAFIESSL